MTVPQPQLTFDARPLTDPVDAHAVRAFSAAQFAQGKTTRPTAVIGALAMFGIVVLLVLPAARAVVSSITGSGAISILMMVPIVVFALIMGVVGLIGFLRWRAARVTRYRLDHFARSNGMTYETTVSSPRLPGMIFNIGSSRMAADLIRGTSPRFVEFGNYEYTVQSGKDSSTVRWGYVAVKLDVPLPNIVLDAKGNNSFRSNLPASFQKEQRLSLEGDFDQYFTLYCPEGYERDALYLFTPDIMARFMDNAAELDVEIVDDWLFLYTKRRVSTLDPATWAWLFGAVGALLTKFDQWARWRDERLLLEGPDQATPAPAQNAAPTAPLPFAAPAGRLTPPPGVANEGRRLKRRVQWLPIVVTVLVLAFWFWNRMS